MMGNDSPQDNSFLFCMCHCSKKVSEGINVSSIPEILFYSVNTCHLADILHYSIILVNRLHEMTIDSLHYTFFCAACGKWIRDFQMKPSGPIAMNLSFQVPCKLNIC